MSLIFPKKPLYAPMLGTLGGGSARGFGRGFVAGGDITTNYDPLGDGSGRALYMFENNANDAGGTWNATAYAGAGYNTTYYKLGTHSLDVTNGGYVLTPNLVQPEISPWTAMWWWRRPNSSGLSVNCRMVDFKEHTTSQGTTVSWESDSSWHFILRVNSTGPNSAKYVGSGSSLNNGNWHHICVGASGTYGSQIPFVYVNGQSVNSNTSYGRSDSSEAAGIKIGTGYGGDSTGYFDNWRLFHGALTQSEIQTIYNAEV